MIRARQLAAAIAACAGAAAATNAQQDNNVQWDLLSHVADADRTPALPVDGQTFDIVFQSGHFDIVSARVGVDLGADGGPITWIPATYDSTRGPIDRWAAAIPATADQRIAYVIEVTDGTDTDYYSAAGPSDAVPALADWWTLDYATLEHAPLGSTPLSTGGTVFRVWAPNASSANVRGSFNGWGLADPMTRLGDDFIARVPEAEAGDQYKYFFSGQHWRPDPRARHLLGANNYNAVIVDRDSYVWQHPDFTPAPAEEWVIYQLHIGSFAGGSGDPVGRFSRVSGFRDVAERVQHLQDLGINAVMLNPAFEFPGDRSGGYNPTTSHAFESAYGSPDDFKFMIDTLHGAGIAVLMDTVWNHFSISDNFLWDYDGTQIYYDTPSPVDTPWGAQGDIDRPEVFDYQFDSTETMMGEFMMDGIRHDAVFELTGATQAISGQNLMKASMAELRRRFPDTHVIGEIYDNSAWNTAPFGIHMDAQYHEAFKNALQDAINAAAFGTPNLSRLGGTINGSGTWVERDAVFNYFELHDDAWPLNGGNQRAVREIDTTPPYNDRYALGRTKLANGLVMLSQGLPGILMGTEWAEYRGFEAEQMDWRNRLNNSGVLRFYTDLIGLRTGKRALFANSPARVFHVNNSGKVLAFERWGSDGRSYVIVANFGNNARLNYRLGIPRAGAWGVVLNSEDTSYQGVGEGSPTGLINVESIGAHGSAQSAVLEIPPHGFLLLQHNPEFIGVNPCPFDITGPAQDGNPDGTVDASDLTFYIDAYIAQFGSTGNADLTGPAQDGNPDGVVDASDLTYYIDGYIAGFGPCQ